MVPFFPTVQCPAPGQVYCAVLDRFARTGTILVGVIAAAVLVGWVLDVAALKSVLPGLATMKVNTASGFILSAVALLLIHVSAPGSQAVRFARIFAFIVLAVGGLSLAEYVYNVDFNIDQLILRAGVTDAAPPGRMSPATALGFFILGLILLVLKACRARLAASVQWLVIPSLFISTLAIVGYAYDLGALYKVKPFSSMALHTALSFFILAFSAVAADTSHGFAKIALSDTAGGVVARGLLPALPFMLFVIGWLALKGEELNWYEFHFGLALTVILSIAVSGAIISWTASALHKADLVRKDVEEEIRGLNASLEQRVKERTEELAKLSAKLTEANRTLEQLSLQDALTGLANRRHFDMYLESQVAVARRYRRPLSLILCDVDAFKRYNDRYGHQAGDECLRRTASAIQSCCRRPADLVVRYGGEEFAAILPDTDLRGATQIAETIREAVAQLRIPHAASPVGPYVSISGGIAYLRLRERTNAQELIAEADQSLYEAKRQGRDRIFSMQAETV